MHADTPPPPTRLVRRRHVFLLALAVVLAFAGVAAACPPWQDRTDGAKQAAVGRKGHRKDGGVTAADPAPTSTASSTPTTVATSLAPATTVVPTTTAPPAPPVTETPSPTQPPSPTITPGAALPGSASAAIVPSAPPGGRRTFTVAPGGDDSGPGSTERPWGNLNRAVERLVPGDTLLVRGGRYQSAQDDQFDIVDKQGAPDAWITITAAPGERPIVQLNSFWQGFNVQRSSYVEIRGLEIVGTALSDQRFTDGIEIRDSHHVRAVGNVVHDTGGCGICSIGSDHVVIASNEVYGTSKWNDFQTSGISVFQSRNDGTGDDARGWSTYIVGNRSHHNTNIKKSGTGLVTDGNCIILDENNLSGYTGRILVANNLCFENGGRGIHVLKTSRVLVVNNTLVNDLRHPDIDGGELTVAFTTDVVFRNNVTSAARPGAGIVNWDATGITFDRNLHVGQRPPAAGATDLVAAAAIGGDFKPTSASAALDAGATAGAPSVDIDGRSRAVPDIGAFEVR